MPQLDADEGSGNMATGHGTSRARFASVASSSVTTLGSTTPAIGSVSTYIQSPPSIAAGDLALHRRTGRDAPGRGHGFGHELTTNRVCGSLRRPESKALKYAAVGCLLRHASLYGSEGWGLNPSERATPPIAQTKPQVTRWMTWGFALSGVVLANASANTAPPLTSPERGSEWASGRGSCSGGVEPFVERTARYG